MAKWKPTRPTCCKGQRPDGKDGCIHFEWKRMEAFDRRAYEGLQVINYEGTWEWFHKKAPYCNYHKNYHHRITGTWTKGEYPFLQEVWFMGCIYGKIRDPKARGKR